MELLPDDLISFVWGLVLGAAGLFLTGVFQEAGKDAWSLVKRTVRPPPPEPVKVDAKFAPTLYAPGDCAWVPEGKCYNREAEGGTYYPHPSNGGKCFRQINGGSGLRKEFLMVKPGAKPAAESE